MKGTESFSLTVNPSFIEKMPKDYEIRVIRNGIESYLVHLSVVSSYSLKIRTLSLCDPVRRTFEYPEEDPYRYFELVIKYMYGEEIQITKQNVRFLNNAAAYLEIYPLLEETSRCIMQWNLFSNVLACLKNAKNISFVYPEIFAVAANFENVKEIPEFYDLPIPVYDAILTARNLASESENSLYLCINKLIEKHEGQGYEQLFAHLVLEDIDPPYVHAMRQRLTHDMIGGAIWKVICQRLLCRVETQEDPQKKQLYRIPNKQQNKQQIIYQKQAASSQPFPAAPETQQPILHSRSRYVDYTMRNGEIFNGIFANLYKRTGKNPCTAQFVTMDGGGGRKYRFLPRLLEYDNFDTYWNSYGNGFNYEDQWITIIFNKQEVVLTGYTFSSPSKIPNYTQPKSWRISGSRDHTKWETIEEVFNNDEMNKPNPKVYFSIKNHKEPYTMFKIEQLANHYKKNSPDQYQFCLNAIEFFGYVADL
jgi:hypothetical protein